MGALDISFFLSFYNSIICILLTKYTHSKFFSLLIFLSCRSFRVFFLRKANLAHTRNESVVNIIIRTKDNIHNNLDQWLDKEPLFFWEIAKSAHTSKGQEAGDGGQSLSSPVISVKVRQSYERSGLQTRIIQTRIIVQSTPPLVSTPLGSNLEGRILIMKNENTEK